MPTSYLFASAANFRARPAAILSPEKDRRGGGGRRRLREKLERWLHKEAKAIPKTLMIMNGSGK